MEAFSFTGYLLTAFALIFVIEGLLWSLFPDKMKAMMALALITPNTNLRRIGFIMVALGFIMIILFGQISG